MTTHRQRAAEYAEGALTLRSMSEALELRAAEELALAREAEFEAEARMAFRYGASIATGVPCWPPCRRNGRNVMLPPRG